ncbi:MAG: Ada metal-binding domain-containing protein [Gemmatimonadota bacterium]
MPLDRSSCYRALSARDARFDGVFFVGVTSTRIYCRPVCRVKTPREANCRYFSHAAAAERAGFRPCLRCRPELAPGTALVDATAQLAERATRAIAAGALNGGSLERLATSLGVTSRHLRRAVAAHIGVSPIDLATTHRLLLAKRLLHETSLPVAQVAFAAGFESLRRFNAAFKGRYRLAPGALRRAATPGDEPVPPAAVRVGRRKDADDASRRGAPPPDASPVELTLEYRPPLDWESLSQFLAARATPGAEYVEAGRYVTTVRIPRSATGTFTAPALADWGAEREVVGHIEVEWRAARADGGRVTAVRRAGTIAVRLSASLLPALMPLLARLRDLLDLDANPDAIARHLVRAGVAESAASFGGIRIPGTLDGFSLAVRAILGQQVSVKGATTVMGRLVERFGEPYAGSDPRLTRLMPTAATLASCTTGDIASLGMPGARADAVLALAHAVASGALVLAPGGDVTASIRTLTGLPGIGDWTAHYIAMRALRWPDAFPANDLVLRRAAGNATAAQLLKRAEDWRPWRAYAAMHLWRTVSSAPVTPSSRK